MSRIPGITETVNQFPVDYDLKQALGDDVREIATFGTVKALRGTTDGCLADMSMPKSKRPFILTLSAEGSLDLHFTSDAVNDVTMVSARPMPGNLSEINFMRTNAGWSLVGEALAKCWSG